MLSDYYSLNNLSSANRDYYKMKEILINQESQLLNKY